MTRPDLKRDFDLARLHTHTLQTLKSAWDAYEDAKKRSNDAADDDAPDEDALYDKLMGAEHYLDEVTNGPLTCATCARQYRSSAGNIRYSADCPHAPHGYNPLTRLRSGLPESEIFCEGWQCDRHWYYATTTAQQDRDMVPGHLKP